MPSSEKLTNGINEEDPYKSEGYIELKIEDFSGFAQQPINSCRLNDDPIFARGMPWKILAKLLECDIDGQKQNCLGYYLQCATGTVFPVLNPSWSCSATAQLKILAQNEGGVDFVRKTPIDIFNANQTGWGFHQYMTIEDLMNPDNGLYNEQTDSIVLAADFTADKLKGVGEYVLVAENELALDKDSFRFSMQIGHMNWEINAKNEYNSLVLTCKDLAKVKGVNNSKVLLGLFGYHRGDPKSEAYSPFPEKSVHYHLFTRKDNSLTVKFPAGSANLLFIIRVYKQRSQLPDFTKQTIKIGRFPADVELRVGDQQFHVNKQLLSTLSPFFDRNFNGLFDSAKQHELKLSLNTHSAELFHHFLLVLCIKEALPNSMNVAALFTLADFYDAENVRQKCDQHLRMAREMPIEKRVLLACDHGSEETRDLIVESANLEQSKRINHLLMEKYCPKH